MAVRATVLLLCCFTASYAADLTLSDETLFDLRWSGDLSEEIKKETQLPTEKLVMTTNNNEKYICHIPYVEKLTAEETNNQYSGPSATELLNELHNGKPCTYRIEAYWTYEVCHGKHVRQYHESKEEGKSIKLQQYFLGHFEKLEETRLDENGKAIPTVFQKNIEGKSYPMFPVRYTGGTPCDLKEGKPREVTILYLCSEEAHNDIIVVEEVATCTYDIVIQVKWLCRHPVYNVPTAVHHSVECYGMDGAPAKPTQLKKFETEQNNWKRTGVHYKITGDDGRIYIVQYSEDDPDVSTGPVVTINNQVPPNADTANPNQLRGSPLGTTTDQQLLREFLGGSNCLHGGQGWWKHEFCFRSHVKQYHQDQNGRQVINLGYWNEQKHLDWLTRNPAKKSRKNQITLHYGDGDICDLTKLNRHVEVRLICKEDPSRPHAVTIYLLEQSPCEYILGIESPIMCKLTEIATESGLIPSEFKP